MDSIPKHQKKIEIKTFNEWSAMGFRIRKGSKACGFTDDNEALFREDQVYDTRYIDGDQDMQEDYDLYEASAEHGPFAGTPWAY